MPSRSVWNAINCNSSKGSSSAKILKKMERETGIEPATSSLGRCAAIENKEQLRPWRCILTTASHLESGSYANTGENGVNGVKSDAPLTRPSIFLTAPPLDRLSRCFAQRSGAIHVIRKFSLQSQANWS